MFLYVVIVVTVLSGFGCTGGKSEDCSKLPNINDLDKKTFCPKDEESYGHTLVVLDLTSKLEQAQINSIKQKVFSEEFYKKYKPFTKFSYVLIDSKSHESRLPRFTMCRPKTGSKNSSYDCDHGEWLKEAPKYVKKKWDEFIRKSKEESESIFKGQTESDNSLIYETIISVFEIPEFDFGNRYAKRNLIIVSDMMQHSERLSFYDSCKSQNSGKPDRCPKLDQVLTPSTRDYIKGTSGELKAAYDNVNVEVVLLSNRHEASARLTPSLRNLWKEFFMEFLGKEDVKFDLPLDTN